MLLRLVESAQYLAIRYSERLEEAGVAASVGSRGDSYDNALAETVNGLYKAECYWRQDSWADVGGPGTIVYCPQAKTFEISQTAAVHREIRWYLDLLKKPARKK